MSLPRVQLRIVRLALLESCTPGVITVATEEKPGRALYCARCIERPWRDNVRRVSCIPAGEYTASLRPSSTMSRATGGACREMWTLDDVPGRDYIGIHPGNSAADSLGCILPGKRIVAWWSGGASPSEMAVTDSRDTQHELYEAIDGERDIDSDDSVIDVIVEDPSGEVDETLARLLDGVLAGNSRACAEIVSGRGHTKDEFKPDFSDD